MTLFHNLILLCIQSGSLLSNVIVTVNLNESLSLPLSSSSLLSSSPSSQPTDDLEISSDKVNTKDSQLENEQSRVRRDAILKTGVLSIKDVVRQKDITKSNAKILGPKKKC